MIIVVCVIKYEKNIKIKWKTINTCVSKYCQEAGQTYSEAVAETLGRGIVQTQMGCGQGRKRRRRRKEVGQLAQIRR